jgi:hypothetical protein
MNPLLDLAALQSSLLAALLVLPAVLSLIVLRAFLQHRLDQREEAFEARCRSIDVHRYRDRNRRAA